MRAMMVKVGTPRRDQLTGLSEAIEQVFVQTLIPHPAVEAFHKTVLHRLTGCNVMPVNQLAVVSPGCRLRHGAASGLLAMNFADHVVGNEPGFVLGRPISDLGPNPLPCLSLKARPAHCRDHIGS